MGEPLAGAADTRLYFVDHQQPFFLRRQLAQLPQIVGTRRHDPTFALDDFRQYGHDVLVVLCDGTDGFDHRRHL